MLSKSSIWELGFVQYIAKFTISRFVISRFECIWFKKRKYLTWSNSPKYSPSAVFSSVLILLKNIFIDPKCKLTTKGFNSIITSFCSVRFSFSVSRLIRAANNSTSVKKRRKIRIFLKSCYPWLMICQKKYAMSF